MSDIDDVLERLVADPAFRTQLRDDPAAALSGYVLEGQDAELLAATLDEGEGGGEHAVEQRTSKSTILGILVGIGGGPAATDDLTGSEEPSEATSNKPKEIVVVGGKVDPPPPPPPPPSADIAGDQLQHSSEGIDAGTAEDGRAADAGGNRPPFETIELVPHTITYTDETTGIETIGDVGHGGDEADPFPESGETEPARTDPSLIGKITPKPLTDEPDGPATAGGSSDVLAAAEDTEPALNAYAPLTANGAALDGDDAISDPGGSTNSRYQERIANEAFLAQPDADAASTATDDPEFKYIPVRRSAQSASDQLQAPDAATGADGNDVAIEEIVLQNEGFEPASPEDASEGTGEGPRDAGGG